MPVAGLKVSAGLASALTTASGTYSLSVPPGHFVVTVLDQTNAVPSGYFLSPGGLTTDPATATTVDVTAGDALGTDVQLPAGTTVSGTVKNTSLVAIAGIDVLLTPI